jgi:hypothetical protein
MTMNEAKQKALLDFIKVLKQGGFRVFAPAKLTTYCHIVKDDKIGYVEYSNGGFKFSTVHKPCRQCGTGFSMHREVYSPTLDMANDTLAFAPYWASSTDRQAIKKYKNWEEYVSHPHNLWSPQVEL